MPTQREKAQKFIDLHQRETAFIIPNPYDAGTARLLALAGFEALATTSGGYAFTAGKADNHVNRDEILGYVREIVSATDLPISADLENGYGDSPEAVAETIRLAAATGIVGASIEDLSRSETNPIYDFDLAVDRVRAAAEAASKLDFPFTLTARTENYLAGRPDLDDTIKRLQAFEQAGANVLYAPGIATREEVSEILSSISKPLNVLVGPPTLPNNREELSALGVKRISVGSALARTALGAFLRAVSEMTEQGTFTFTGDAASYQQLNEFFKR